MTQIQELEKVSYTHEYAVSLKTASMATLATVAVMGALYGLLGFPPTFDGYYLKMYFHSIGIGLAALGVYLVIDTFNIQKYEPPLDFPLYYRALAATGFAAAGGLVYLNAAIDTALPDVGLGLFIVAFLLIGDVGGALFVELMLLPRKKAGVYNEKANYVGRMIPLSRADLKAYSGMGSGYWLAIAAVGSAFLAGLMGAVNLWVNIFGTSFLSGYISYLGLDAPGFIAATLDPHTHEMALAIMAGVVAIVAVRFGALESLSRLRKTVARVGIWIAIIGVVAMTTVYVAIAFANYSPPTLLQSGTGGVNGIAGDDATMSMIGVGAMIVLVPMILSRAVWRDGVRLTIFGTWIAAMILSIVEGFYIELHQDAFSTSLLANDSAFSQAQPMTGLFLLTAVALAMLVVDYYGVDGLRRRLVGWTAFIGLLVVSIGGSLWTFLDPTNTGASFWIYAGGTFLVGLSVPMASVSLRSVRVLRLTRP